MNHTENYNLGLPLVTEKYDVSVFNTNYTMIDSLLKSNNDIAITHINNASNPHGVTAAQIGLGNVNNTSDSSKPVSIPQERAIERAVHDEQTRAMAAEQVNADAIDDVRNSIPGIATTSNAGIVKPDGTSITIQSDGTISATQFIIDSELSTTSTRAVQNKVVTNALGLKADKATTYTKTEVDNLMSSFETDIDWKEAVETYSDIATTYPNPQDGWTVNVKDTDYTYRYNGSSWIVISANAIPNATTSVNGLMTTAMVAKLNGIENGAQVNTITGVKGGAETSYRTGNVNITKENIGLGNVQNVTVNDQAPTFTQASSRANIVSGEKLSVLFGKIMKWFADLKAVAFSGSYNDLSNQPTIGDATLTIQKNGADVSTFSANAIRDVTANISVPTKTSDITNDSGFITAEEVGVTGVKGSAESSYRSGNVEITKANIGLSNVGNFKAVSTVASQGLTTTEQANARANIGAGTSNFSGSYNDLTSKPSIPSKTSDLVNDSDFITSASLPTVNNATLTIQKNGTNVQTFTANQGTNVTANITVPTKTSDLTNDSGYTTNAGTVTQVKVGTTAYNPTSGVITLPAYPSVNNGTLTIQKNGIDVQTFTANQGGNATANITVPTALSELTDDDTHRLVTDREKSLWGSKGEGTVTTVKVGSTSYEPTDGIISLPAYPTDTNTHRPIQVNGTEILGNNTTALNLKAGNNVSVTNSSGTVTIAATDTTYGVVSTSANGLAPKVTDTSKFLKGDGTWDTPIGTTYSAMTDAEIQAGTSTTARLLTPKAFRANIDNKAWVGTCTTASDVATKVVTVDTSFLLVKGARIAIKFTNTNTASNCTLNVNSTGAKPIYYNNAVYAGTSSNICGYTDRYHYYLYDGTNWLWDGTSVELDSLYSAMTDAEIQAGTSTTAKLITPKAFRASIDNKTWVGTCTTAAATAAKVVTVDTGFLLVKGARIGVKYSNSNTASNCTLNVNSTGAKSIYFNTAVYTGNGVAACGCANRYTYYIYDGTYWVWDGMGYDDNSTNYLRNDASSTLTASGSAYLNVKSSTIDMTQADNAVTTTQYPAYIIQDKNGRDMSRLETVVEPNGQIKTYLQVCNYNTTTNTHFRTGLAVLTNKSQDVWYSLANPHYFHRELGFGYGICSTAGSEREKAVTMERFRLVVGGIIGVRFTNTNTYSSTTDNPVTLNVNNTGAKNIWYGTTHSGAGNTGANTNAYGSADYIIYYMYDGTYWVWLSKSSDSNTTYSAMSTSELTTGTATTSRVVRADYLKAGIISIVGTEGYTKNAGTVTKVSTGAGLTGGDITTTGTVKVDIKSETKSSLTAAAKGSTSSREYAVGLDSEGDLSVNVPWSDTIPSAYCSTAAATAAKVASCSGYALLSKSFLHVIITTANTSQTALTLNVNGKGAKPIYINGSASSTSNYTLPAGSYFVYYNGTNYYFRTDGKITGSITGDAATVNGKTVAVNVPSGAVFTDTHDTWTSTSTVTSAGVVTFSGLNDSYGYDLYCQDKALGIQSVEKTGSGTSTTLKYTLIGASGGETCKLRILI